MIVEGCWSLVQDLNPLLSRLSSMECGSNHAGFASTVMTLHCCDKARTR